MLLSEGILPGQHILRNVDSEDEQFSGGANFDLAEFSREAHFRSAKFSRAYFESAEFSGGANFNEAEFSRGANFSGMFIEDKANFNYVLFEDGKKILFGIEDLSRVSFMNTDITRVRFNDRARWGKVFEEELLETSLVYCETLRTTIIVESTKTKIAIFSG